ncbi:MAG: efflux RND transporter periplasmic adaptor subunit [Parvibaculum sp.]
MTQRAWIIGGMLIAAGAAIAIYFSFFSSETLTAYQPTRGKAVEAVYATGTVEPVQVSRVGAKISGRIAQLLVREGESVVEGGVIAILDNREVSASVRELEARLSYAKSEVDRFRRLFRSGNTSAAARDQAEANFQSADAALEAAKVRLEEHFIRAAISGQVMRSEQQLDVGDLVTAGKILFMIGDPLFLWIEAEVDEEDIPRVKIGQRALVRADAFADEALEALVSKITPFGDPIARTYRVHLTLPMGSPLFSGMTTEVNIIVREEAEALLVRTGDSVGTSVWIVDEEDRARAQTITLGAIGAEKTEILSGLADDAWVIARPPGGLVEGKKVQVEREGM